MSKLFNVKEWLTVDDAARHLSILFGEDVTQADVLRFGLDGQLRLSIRFVNPIPAKRGKVVPIEEAEYKEVTSLCGTGTVRLYGGPVLLVDGRESQVIVLEKGLSTLQGVCDLPMIGSERLDIEHEYQKLTGGPSVTLVGLDGAFVEGRDQSICQIQGNFDDDNHEEFNADKLENVEPHIVENNTEANDANNLFKEPKGKLKRFLEKIAKGSDLGSFYPANLPNDGVIVVRTAALRQFVNLVNGTTNEPEKHKATSDRSHISDKLAIMNQAATKFWGNADRADRMTHPSNATVASWLTQYDFSSTLAEKAATLIRPEWAPTGRKPEE